MSEARALDRNRGLISAAEQDRLANAHVLVAGVGGVGGRAAEVLARMGVGTLTIVDPDVFTTSNLNRQAGCTLDTLGQHKADVVADLCRNVSETVTVNVVADGVTRRNVVDLVTSADVVIDGTDFTKPHLAVMMARIARSRGIPVVMAVEVGFGGWCTAFDPYGFALERFLGLDVDVEIEDLATQRVTVPLWRWVAHVPAYVDIAVLRQVASGELDAPAVAPAVEVTAAQLATMCLDLIVGRTTTTAPRIWHIDVRERRARVFTPTFARFQLSALRASLRRRRRRATRVR